MELMTAIWQIGLAGTFHNELNYREKIERNRESAINPRDSQARKICVFFTQHSIEKRLRDLWEWRFFIARQPSFDNVVTATEGHPRVGLSG